MREWQLKSGDPLSLTLAADARLENVDYCDDQIWELSLGGGEPPALAFQTTYGLRARSLRLFPRFSEAEQALTDPENFFRPPVVTRFYPNYLAVSYSPFADIDVTAEYWVPHSQGAGGRLSLVNAGRIQRQLRIEMVGQLTSTAGQRMAPVEIQAAPVLTGETDGVSPVIFMTGSPQAGTGAYPTLAVQLTLEPGATRQFTWTHAGFASVEESFRQARAIAARRWEAERARLELFNAGLVEIYTGDPDWDAAFALAQKQAFSLFLSPTERLPHPSFVLTRLPDQGFSLRGDGSDYNHLWNGQSPLEAYFLSSLVLPAAPQLAQGLVRNFLSVQNEDGFIDWKPGLGGQRSRLLAPPVLATLAWRVYEACGDRVFLDESFPGLLRFFQTWFTPAHDRDGDGIPEWDHLMQTGSEEHPLYSHWFKWSQGAEVSSAESPSLCALLYRECETLLRIARLLGRSEAEPALAASAELQRRAVLDAWNPQENRYSDWDRDTHYPTQGEWLAQRKGPGAILLEREFEHPIRLLVRVETSGESTRRPQVFVYGDSASGHHRIEKITEDHFRWYLGLGSLTGDRVYSAIEKIEIQGVDPSDQIDLFSVNYRAQDQTLLLPLWAGIAEMKQAKLLVKKTVLSAKRFWRPFGIPACPGSRPEADTSVCQAVQVHWNALVGEGLLRYGYRSEAAELVTRLMAAIVQTLKRDGAFRRYYHAETGLGFGERNALHGLAPLGLFLETLGVRLFSPLRIGLSSFNPFPWPVTVKYRGTTILRQKEKTVVIFPDGQTTAVSEPAPKIVSLD
jgi:hypothetical protein